MARSRYIRTYCGKRREKRKTLVKSDDRVEICQDDKMDMYYVMPSEFPLFPTKFDMIFFFFLAFVRMSWEFTPLLLGHCTVCAMAQKRERKRPALLHTVMNEDHEYTVLVQHPRNI